MKLTESIVKNLNEEFNIYDDIVDRILNGEDVYVKLDEETDGTNIYKVEVEQFPMSPEKYDEGYVLGWDRGQDPEYDKEQDRKYEAAKKAYEDGEVFVFDAVKVEDGKINKTGCTLLTSYGVDELINDLRALNAKNLNVSVRYSLDENYDPASGEEGDYAIESVTEYTILFKDGTELDKEYGGEFITEDKEEADELFNDIKEEGKLNQVHQYYSKEWVRRDPYDDWEEGYVEVFSWGEDDTINESFDQELLNYMLDNDIIIGAEYDHPEEYDDKHWDILYGEALDKAKADKNKEILDKLNAIEDKKRFHQYVEYVNTWMNERKYWNQVNFNDYIFDKNLPDEKAMYTKLYNDLYDENGINGELFVSYDEWKDNEGSLTEANKNKEMLNNLKESVNQKGYVAIPGYHEWLLLKDGKQIYSFGDLTDGLPEVCSRKNIEDYAMDIAEMWENPEEKEAIAKALADGLYSQYGEEELKEASDLADNEDSIVKSPLELNTGVLPILDTNTYGKEEYLWSSYDAADEDGEPIPEEDQPTFEDLKKLMVEYAQPVLQERIAKVLPSAKVNVTGVWSPQYYNYEGDQVEFTVSFDENEFNALMEKALADPKFNDFLGGHYRSYDGFISYMADNERDFKDQEGWKKFVQVIMFFADEYSSEDDIFDFWEKVRENF